MSDDEKPPPYWVLISVLFSTFSLSPAVAMALHQVAEDLYLDDEAEAPVAGYLLSGKVRNLRREFLVGTIGGPAFEAEVDTERGHGTVRFLLTREALELAERRRGKGARPSKRPRYLN